MIIILKMIISMESCKMNESVSVFFMQYKCAVVCIMLTDSYNQGPQKNNNAISFNSHRSALVKSSHLCHSTQRIGPPSYLLPPFPSHFWRIYHISISASPCHSVLVNRAQTCCLWPPQEPWGGVIWFLFPFSDNFLPPFYHTRKKKEKKRPGLATTTTSKKNSAEGFLWDKDCQCQLQYDKCQCYEDRHEQGWAGWPFPNVTCHQSFMSPSKQYVRGIKNHYTLELCYTGQK